MPIESARSDVAAMAGGITGQVTLGLLPTVAHSFSGDIVEEYSRNFPQVSLSVKSAMSSTLQHMATQNRVDLALTYDPSNQRYLRAQPLLDEDIYLIGPADNPFASKKSISLKKVLEQTLVLPEEKHGLRIILDNAAAKLGKTNYHGIEISAWPLMTDVVRRGLGFTILPSASVHDMLVRGELAATPIVSPQLTRTLVLLSPSDRPVSLATRKMAELIVNKVSGFLEQGLWTGKMLAKKTSPITKKTKVSRDLPPLVHQWEMILYSRRLMQNAALLFWKTVPFSPFDAAYST